MGRVDAAVIDDLTSPRGRELMALLPQTYDPDDVVALVMALRSRGYPAELVRAALTQCELRTRAKEKFGDLAAEMFFTRDGLEQSTRWAVAQWHARRFADAGVQHVVDLGCGVGSDAMAFARAGLDVTAVDADPLTAAIAAANICAGAARPGLGRHEVRMTRAEDVDWAPSGRGVLGAWLDPARRTPGIADVRGRTRRLAGADMSPSWDFVLRVAADLPAVSAKFSVGLPHRMIPSQASAVWVSDHGQPLECVLGWGLMAPRPGSRSAILHRDGKWHHLEAADERPADGAAPPAPGPVRATSAIPEFVYDVDRAALAAGLRGEVARLVQGWELGSSGYVVSSRAVATPWARCLRVREVLPVHTKTLRAWVKRADVGSLTVKKRPSQAGGVGARIDADSLRRSLSLRGANSATLLLTDVDDRASALWVSAVSDDEMAAN